VGIHRFTPRPASLPTDNSVTAAALDEVLAATASLGAIPERSTWAGRFDVIRSDALASAVVCASLDHAGETGTETRLLRFVHHQGEATLTPDELFGFLEERLPGVENLKRMGLLEWVGAIKRQGYGWLFSTHDLSLTRQENGVETVLVNQR